MNNLKYYNDSLAYDFEMFMPKAKPEGYENINDNIVKLPSPKIKARKKAAKKRMSATAFAVLTTVFILAALCGNISLRIMINETNSAINDMKTEINALDSELTSLEVEYERRISYSNIELEATKLGMSKMDKDQVVYIRVNDKNSAVTQNGEVLSEK
ncbi:MAG: hypothetical protein IJZ75_04200 [Clostridia bacterium]|nr:hypothetical protein [Clostridia bacterium]